MGRGHLRGMVRWEAALIAVFGTVSGLAVGMFLGLFVGPRLRSWLGWREWVDASREADLADRPLKRFGDGPRDGRGRAQGPSRIRVRRPNGS